MRLKIDNSNIKEHYQVLNAAQLNDYSVKGYTYIAINTLYIGL